MTQLLLWFCMQEGPAYAEAFFNVLRSVTKEDTVQYVLAILDEMVAGADLLYLCTPCSQLRCVTRVPFLLFKEMSRSPWEETDCLALCARRS